MSTPHAQLLQRIMAFELDQGKPALTFAQRLARENRWPLDFASRAILEYKRFIFLACTADHAVTPSEQVDQVWHLHLTYTRSYWDRFCGQVLGRPLHHDPTRGGDDEDSKYRELYERTLASYAACFGESAPVECWPDVEQRFAPQQREDRPMVTAQKSPVRRRLLTGMAGLVAGLMLVGLTGGMGSHATSNSLIRADVTGAVLGIGFLCMMIMLVWLFNRSDKGGKRRGGRHGGGGTTGCGAGGCSSSSHRDSSGCSNDSSGCSSDSGGSSGCGGGGCGGGGD